MKSPESTQIKAKMGREAEAKLALEHTVLTPKMAWTLTILFLMTICSVPILQHVVEIRRNIAERNAQMALGEAPTTNILPRFYEVLGELPTLEQLRSVRSLPEAWSLIPDADRFRQHENALQDDSLVVQWLLPRAQNLMLRAGAGNEQAYVGREGWLMYRPDVDYLTSRGFLDPSLQQVRKRAGDSSENAVQPDPVKAIVDFRDQLAQRGIDLIVMPMPVKPMIHAEKMSARYTWNHENLQNPSYEEFRQALKRHNVKVFDVTALLLEAKKSTRQSQFLASDTHWTPQAMELCAREMARFVKTQVALPPRDFPRLTRSSASISAIGDIGEMLRLPEKQTQIETQRVTIRPIKTQEGQPYTFSRSASILLLGDSFCNVYSMGDMNWGENAGFGQQVSFYLQQPLDAIINNAGGSHVTREILARDLKRRKNRLRSKKLVIWEFSMRDLLFGDWKIIQMPK